MRSRYPLIVAVLATLALCVRSTNSTMGFFWALNHGAGSHALIALVPLGIPVAVLWLAFWFARRSRHQRARLVFAGFAVAIVLLNEAPLPGTEAQRLRLQRAMDAIEVRSIRDELLLSRNGNPIGIRVTYEVVTPRRIVAFAPQFDLDTA